MHFFLQTCICKCQLNFIFNNLSNVQKYINKLSLLFLYGKSFYYNNSGTPYLYKDNKHLYDCKNSIFSKFITNIIPFKKTTRKNFLTEGELLSSTKKEGEDNMDKNAEEEQDLKTIMLRIENIGNRRAI